MAESHILFLYSFSSCKFSGYYNRLYSADFVQFQLKTFPTVFPSTGSGFVLLSSVLFYLFAFRAPITDGNSSTLPIIKFRPCTRPTHQFKCLPRRKTNNASIKFTLLAKRTSHLISWRYWNRVAELWSFIHTHSIPILKKERKHCKLWRDYRWVKECAH